MIIYYKDIDSYENIYKTILLISEQFRLNLVIPIIFHNDVKFVEPLFFILLLNLHDKYKNEKVLVIDILDLDYSKETIEKYEVQNKIEEEKNIKINKQNILEEKKTDERNNFIYPNKDNRQHYIYRILLEFLDTGYFVKEKQSEMKWNKYINDYENTYYRDIEEREKNYDRSFFNKLNKSAIVNKDTEEVVYQNIYFYYSKEHNDSLFQNNNEIRHLLPIFKINNFPKSLFNTLYYNDIYTKKDDRKEIYEGLLANVSDDFFRKRFETCLEKIFQIVKSNHQSDNLTNLIPPLKNLLYECIDNVKRHTNEHTNGYFCFYYDVISKEFKIIIYDDFIEGFLNTYKKTLENEFKELTNKFDINAIDEKIKQPFLNSISKLNEVTSESDKEIDHLLLKKIFDNKGTFETHQIPRVIMHFGIPTLVKIINDVGGKFLIRLHRKIDQENSLYYYLDNTNEVKNTSIHGLDGTHIYITIPDNAVYKIRNAQPLNLKSDDLVNISENKNLIDKKIKEFVPITEKNSESPYRIFDYNAYLKKEPNNSISDFLRDLYYHAYKSSVLDALVINFPIKEFELYLQNLIYILFADKIYNEESIIPLNVVFFNKTSLDIVFIGGRNYSEFYYSNKLISKHYGKYHDKITDVLVDSSNNLENTYAETNFFYKTNNDVFVLPFELCDSSEVSIQHLIMNNLNENKISLHVDVGRGIHVSEFYKFDIIFQNSRFIDRMVHKILEKINSITHKLNKKNNIKFIGIGKYSNLFLAIIHKNLKKRIEEYYLVLDNLLDKNNYDNLKEYIENNKDANAFFIFTPVSFDGKQIKKKIIDKYSNHSIFWLNTIQITLEGYPKENIDNHYSLLELQLEKEKYYKVSDNDSCKLCQNDFELPLYKINEKDYFSIDDCHFNNYKEKKLKPYIDISAVKWAESMYFGHTKRDNNHYLYYTKTIQFFNKNYKEIVKFLEFSKTKINQQYDISENEIFIIAPMHSTHNKFLTTVNTIIFDGKATILQIDLKKGDNNFYNKEEIDRNTLFFYVDDEISSGTTIQQIYSLLRSNNLNSGFSGIIILIDRMSQTDENYVEQLVDLNNINLSESIHLFTKLEIKPIKTTKYEECFLCKRKNEYKELLKYTVLDINRFQIAERISKLNIIDHSSIDFEHGIKQNSNGKINLNRKIKDYIKMIAVDYINSNFKVFSKILSNNYNNVFKEYITLENNFTDYIYNNIIKNFDNTEKFTSIFKDICNFEASIALIKALSFPKIVYFKDMRNLATIILLIKIKENISKEPLEYIFDNGIIHQLGQIQKKSHNKDFINQYSKKLNINYLNFLYITAGYLNIQSILNIENLDHYFYLSTKKREKDFNHILLQPYQFAVKMVSINSIDRSKYLDTQIKEFFKTKEDAKQLNCTDYTLIEALAIENNYSISKVISKGITFDDSLKLLIKDNNNIIEKVNICKENIEKIIINNLIDKKTNIKVESIFVNENIHTKYDDFESYLENLRFIDILDDFNEIDYDNPNLIHINRIVKGSLSKEPEEAMQISRDEDTKEIKNIDNTWSNVFIEYFSINNENKNCLLIRLVDINIDKLDNIKYPKAIENLWYKPIGCIAISCSTNKVELLNIAKIVLSIQNDLVEFIKEEFSHETFSEIIRRKNQENLLIENKRRYAWQIKRINHSVKDYINLKPKIDTYLKYKTAEIPYKDYLEKLSTYSWGLQHLSSIVSAEPKKSIDELELVDIYSILREGSAFNNEIKRFILVVQFFNDKLSKQTKNINLCFHNITRGRFKLKLEEEIHMAHICFEFIFNSIKNLPENCENPIIRISTLEGESGINIENTIDGDSKEKQEEILKKIDESLINEENAGLNTIKKILNDQNYTMKFTITDKLLTIQIRKRNEK
ncbi:hypothetical protein [Aliarcobacter butzleri]|uniref:hypothetical protein n=1 Tax=Aliarcobacter butzleri TaxID=28197 RepID=UPI003BB0C82C